MANIAELHNRIAQLEAENNALQEIGGGQQQGQQQVQQEQEDRAADRAARAAERAADAAWRGQQHFQRSLSSCPLFYAKTGGQSFRRHINNFKLWRISRGIQDHGLSKIALAQSMRDSAAERTRHIEPGTAKFAAIETYEDYEKLVSDTFLPVGEKALSRTEFLEYKQGPNEDIAGYMSIKFSLYQVAYAEGERSFISLRTAVVKGLYSNVIKRMAMRRNPENEEELYQVVCDSVASEREAYLGGYAESTSLEGLRAISYAFKAEGGSTEEPMDINAMSSTYTPGKKTTPGNNKKCFKCGSSTHMIKDCKKNTERKHHSGGGNDRNKRSEGKKDLECHYCHKRGHFKKDCYKYKRDQNGGKINKMDENLDGEYWPEDTEEINELQEMSHQRFLGQGTRRRYHK